MTKKSGSMVQLDGLRGVAVLMVLFSHAANAGYVLSDSFKIAGDGSGKIGVWLFFVLSAFLLTHQMLSGMKQQDIFTRNHLLTYAKRRILRIYPLFTASVLFLVITGSVLPFLYNRFAGFGISDALSHLFLIKERAHLWTISTEVKFYFVIPFIAYGLLACKQSIVRGALFIAVLGILFLTLINQTDWATSQTVFYYVPIFLCGSFAAFLYNLYPQGFFPRLAQKTSVLFCLAWLSVMTALMPNAFFLLSHIRLDAAYPVIYLFWSIFFGSSILYLLWYKDTLLARLIAHKIFVFFGYISFSMYVWHFIILDIIETGMPNAHTGVKAFLFYGITLAVSTLSYFFIERPFMRRKMTLSALR